VDATCDSILHSNTNQTDSIEISVLFPPPAADCLWFPATGAPRLRPWTSAQRVQSRENKPWEGIL